MRLLVLFKLTAISILYSGLSFAAEVSGPKIDFPTLSHDFGEVHRGMQLKASFVFKNIGTEDLLLTGVHAACGCTVVAYDSKKVYRPQESGSIDVSFDTTNFSGSVAKIVTVMTNEKLLSTRNITLNAKIIEDIAVQPPVLNFGRNEDGKFTELVAKISINGDVRPVGIKFNDKVIRAQLAQDAGSWVVRASLLPNLPAGFLRESIVLETSSATLPKIDIPVRAEVEGSIKIAPSYLEFGRIEPMNSIKRDIVIEKFKTFDIVDTKTELNLNGTKITDLGSYLEISNPGSGKPITVTLKNTTNANGSVHGRIALLTNDPTQPQLNVDFYAFFGTVTK